MPVPARGCLIGRPGDDPNDEAALLELFAGDRSDPATRAAIIERFQPLADYLARRFTGRGEPIEDLQQVASIGLLNAIDRFDPEREVRFATYAAATIVGELKRHLRDKAWAIRVPRPLQELGLRLNRVVPEMTQRLGRSPTIPEIAERLDTDPESVIEAMDASRAYSATSLDAPIGDEGTTRGELLGADDPSLAAVEGWSAVAPAIERLPPRERRVLYLRFFAGLTQSEIAADIGVSQMHVSRILAKTLEELRAYTSGTEPVGEGAT